MTIEEILKDDGFKLWGARKIYWGLIEKDFTDEDILSFYSDLDGEMEYYFFFHRLREKINEIEKWTIDYEGDYWSAKMNGMGIETYNNLALFVFKGVVLTKNDIKCNSDIEALANAIYYIYGESK